MKKILLLGLLAGMSFIACNKTKTSAPAAKSDDAVQVKLKQLAGSGATDCGRLDVRAADQQLTGASDCATKAAGSKHPFYVAYDMPGMSTGVAGGSDGKLFAVELQGSGTGAQLQSGPCPAELRVAKSGRVTCLIPGTMGLNPSAADPHGGMQVNPGANSSSGIPQPFGTAPSSGTKKAPPQK